MKTSTCRDGTLKNQPNKICELCLVFVTCVHRRVVLGMEGCGMSSTGCVVHVVVYGEWVVLWVAVTLLRLSVAGMVSYFNM